MSAGLVITAGHPDRNIIDLLTRYPVRHLHDAGENRLTAALGAALMRTPRLARELAKEWGVPAIEPVEVNPQAPTRGERAGFIDLELRFGKPAARSVVWIEAKLRSPLSGSDQLRRYARDLEQMVASHRLLILLAPAGDRSHFADVAPIAARNADNGRAVAAYFVSWHQVYACLHTHRDTDDWFTEEVLGYMKSVGIEQPSVLTRSRLRALELADEAAASLEAIIDCATHALSDRWKPTDPYHYERFYKPPVGQRWGSATRFVMGVDGPGLAKPSYFAGIVWPAGKGPFRSNSEHLARWQAKFVDWQSETYGKEEWLWRAAPLGGLVKLPTLGEQGKRVAEHADSAFNYLVASRRPDDA